jgi:V8-like Glu-specific endopeptidase
MSQINFGNPHFPTSLGLGPLQGFALVCWLLVLPCSALAAIYGDDSRVSSLDGDRSELVESARHSVAVMVRRSDILQSAVPEIKNSVEQDLGLNSDWRRLAGATLGRRMNLCSGERFADEPAPGFCTAFLVGESVMATAGHCIRSAVDCSHTAVVFGFEAPPPPEVTGTATTTRDYSRIRRSDVYFCRGILSRRQDAASGADYALFEVERRVDGRTPLLMRRFGRLAGDEPLVLIGHPGGIPMKVAADGIIRDNSQEDYFVAELDTGGGSSGSPVLNADNGLVEGIVVRGERGYEAKGECWVNRQCETMSCRGEDVTRSSALDPLVP